MTEAGDTEMPPRRVRAINLSWSGRWLGVLIAGMVIGTVAGIALSVLRPSPFTARMDFVVVAEYSQIVAGSVNPNVTDRDVTTQVSLITSPVVRQRAETLASGALDPAEAFSTTNGNLVTIQAAGSTRRGAERAVGWYSQAYVNLLAEQQVATLSAEQETARAQMAAADSTSRALDDALSDVPDNAQSLLLAQQSAQRTSLAATRQEADQRISLLQDAISRAPLNVQPLGDAAAAAQRSGLSRLQQALLGAGLGLASAAVAIYNLSPRRVR